MTGEPSDAVADGDNVRMLVDAWTLMVGRLPTSTLQRAHGVASVFGHVPLSFLNVSILDRPLTDPAAFRGAVETARTRAGTCRHSSLVALCTAWAPQGWAEMAAAAGLKPMLNMTGMAADALLPARRPAPAAELRLITDVGAASDLASVNAVAYGMKVEEFDCIANLHLWRERSFGVVAYADGRAAAAAATFVIGDRTYVAFVATLPDARGQGLAEAAIRRAVELAEAEAGPKRLWLHASDMGRPLYESMGFNAGASLPLLQFAAG